MFFGVISLILILENKPISSLACLLVLGVLKIQNIPGFMVIWIFVFLLRAQISYLRFSFYSLIGLGVIIATFGYYGLKNDVVMGVGLLVMFIGVGQMIAGYVYPNQPDEINNAVENFEKKLRFCF